MIGIRLVAALAALCSVACLSATGASTSTTGPGTLARRDVSPEMMFGVNLAGGEFGKVPGTYGKNYIYPNAAEFDYFKSKGLMLVRLPFKWERLQRTLKGVLDAAELGRLDEVVGLARSRGMKIILDVHNYARYKGKLIGSAEVPNSAFTDFWRRVAGRYKNETAIYAYGLMNEPHDTRGLWPAAAQAGVDGIREADMEHMILVSGDGWSGAWSWARINGDLSISDPADNYAFEAHQYFDKNGSGTYKRDYDAGGAYPNIGVDRVRPFIKWLKARNARGLLGEYGVPDDDPRWLTVLDNFLATLKANGLGGTYWAAGPWWGKYPLSVEPRNGQDRPQMSILTKYRTAVLRRQPPSTERQHPPSLKAPARGRYATSARRVIRSAYRYREERGVQRYKPRHARLVPRVDKPPGGA